MNQGSVGRKVYGHHQAVRSQVVTGKSSVTCRGRLVIHPESSLIGGWVRSREGVKNRRRTEKTQDQIPLGGGGYLLNAFVFAEFANSESRGVQLAGGAVIWHTPVCA